MTDKINQLLKKMTLYEKIGQMFQAGYFTDVVTGHDVDSSHTLERIRKGIVGSVLSIYDEEVLRILQKTAVEKSRLGIPLLFAFDILHGYKTSFPINLGLSNTWDMDLVKDVASAIAYETAHRGLHLTFGPMLDLVRDPRWGRVMESNGEDPYLSSELAKAYIHGFQGDDLRSEDTIATCAKHFVAYGLSEAGRDYNAVDLSERLLFNMYLPPFKAAIDSHVSMIMTGFNTVFDRPASASQYLLKDLLRDQLNFNGVIISDSSSCNEIINHKVAKDLKDVAYQCAQAGLEIEMVSEAYIKHLEGLVKQGQIKESVIDQATKHILLLKEHLGLFEDPYRYLYSNSERYLLQEKTIELSLQAAEKSMVLLKNNQILPISRDKKIVLLGPMIDSNDIIGQWAGLAKRDDVITIKTAFNNDSSINAMATEEENLIKSADVVVMAIGESSQESGEGHSKVDLHISKDQLDYFNRIHQLNDNIVLVIFAGRPLMIKHFDDLAKAILYAYQPGMQGGPAIKNLLMGDRSPSGKLTMTFPYHQGQIPIYYNHHQTGRPFNPLKPNYRFQSRYIDCQNAPLYPFGFGLSYGNFIYQNLRINKQILRECDTLLIEIDLYNDSQYSADEIVQCYIEAMVFSVSRPVNELKKFKRITFKPYQKQTVSFNLTVDDFRSYNIDMKWTAEQGVYQVKVGGNSVDLMMKKVEVIDQSLR